MNREQLIALNRRLLQRVLEKGTDQCDAPLQESADIFTCSKRFEQEKQQFFLDKPQVVGFAGEVAEPGSYITAESMGVPLLISRDQNGTLGAFINACGHKGARVAYGFGKRQRPVCQFHGWAYSGDGSLYGRPKRDCFADDDALTGLTRVPVSDRSGLLVVGLHPDMPQQTVDDFLVDIEAQFSGFDFDKMHSIETRRLEVDANWKLVAGLSHESYHFATLHRDTVAQLLHDNAVVDTFGAHSRWAFAMKGIERLADVDESQWPGHIEGAINHTLFPGTVMIKNPEDAQIIRVEPGRHPGHSVVYYSGVCRHPEKIEDARAAYNFGGEVFEKEDLKAAAECQQGLAARGGAFIIGRNEPIVQFWHRQWRELLDG